MLSTVGMQIIDRQLTCRFMHLRVQQKVTFKNVTMTEENNHVQEALA